MKTKVKSIFLLLFLVVFGFFATKIVTKIKHKTLVANQIKTIPNFSFLNIKGGVFAKSNLKSMTPTLFIYFNTECEYCNNETKIIKGNANKFKNIQLLFISFEKPELIKIFSEKHHLNNYDNIHFLCDDKITFATTFDVNGIPCLVLYDKNQNLIEKIKGQTKVETLLKKLNE